MHVFTHRTTIGTVRAHACMYTYVCVYIYKYIYVCVCVCVCVCVAYLPNLRCVLNISPTLWLKSLLMRSLFSERRYSVLHAVRFNCCRQGVCLCGIDRRVFQRNFCSFRDEIVYFLIFSVALFQPFGLCSVM